MKRKKEERTKKDEFKPKAHNTWKINPETRAVKESDKIYDQTKEKLEEKRDIDGVINFFGE